MHSGTDEVLGGSIAGMMENYWGVFWFMVAVIWKYCGYIEEYSGTWGSTGPYGFSFKNLNPMYKYDGLMQMYFLFCHGLLVTSMLDIPLRFWGHSLIR